MDQQGVDVACGHRGAEVGDLGVGVDAGLPRPRVLIEDLDRPRAALDPARDGLRGAARRRHVGADQHAPARRERGAVTRGRGRAIS